MATTIPDIELVERLPPAVRFLLGSAVSCVAIGIAYVFHPLRAFPLILAFPTVVLAAWFFGMWGAVGCALVDTFLVDPFVPWTEFRLVTGSVYHEIRLALFVAFSLLLGWVMRRLSQQRAELKNRELQQRLLVAESERQLAEERARAAEALGTREEMLRMALRLNGMGFWVWDLLENTVYWSDEVFRIAGYEPGSFTPEPETWLKLVHPDDIQMLRADIAHARENGEDYHHRYRVRRPDGTFRWLESQGKCQRDSEGRSARIFGVMNDITQRKHAEEGMLRAEKLAVAGRLAASVAHEINNPLEAVANMLYLMTITDTLESAQGYATRALEELMRISLIAQSTLKFHRQTGTPQITLLSEIVTSVLTLFRAKLQAMQIDVQVQAERELSVSCMPSEAQQIFANLIANAVEALQPGGRLSLRIHPSRDWRTRKTEGMRVTVFDSGMGMDRATVRRIFEPFFTTKADTGTGLGLWVVAQLVERHQGSVRAWSSQREGATCTAFSVFLPIGDIAGPAALVEGSGELTGKARRREDPEQAFSGFISESR